MSRTGAFEPKKEGEKQTLRRNQFNQKIVTQGHGKKKSKKGGKKILRLSGKESRGGRGGRNRGKRSQGGSGDCSNIGALEGVNGKRGACGKEKVIPRVT